jgi:gliding motility-associated-like protein
MLQCEYHCNGHASVTPTGGRQPYTYLWSDPFNQTDSTATGLCIGVYMVNITDSSNCEVIVFDTISAIPAPPLIPGFEANPILTTIYNPEIYFTNLSSGATATLWSFGDGSSDSSHSNASHIFPDDVTGTYTVWQYIINHLGCEDSISGEVTIKGDFAIFAPSAFTPNGDGINETFFPKGFGIDLQNFKLYIYNRWGDVIYKTDNINKPWDGRSNAGKEISQIGVYVWMIIAFDIDGNEHQFVGKVTLLR